MINLEKKFKKEFNTSPTLRKGMEGQKKQWQKKKAQRKTPAHELGLDSPVHSSLKNTDPHVLANDFFYIYIFFKGRTPLVFFEKKKTSRLLDVRTSFCT